MSEFDTCYPPKPEITRKKSDNHLSKTVFSMVLFAVTFSIVIDDYLFIALLIGVLLVHELGHYLMMKRFGYENLNMFFIPFMGAMVQGEKEKYSQKETLIMVLSGPVPGVILGTLLLFYGNYEYDWIIQLGILAVLINALNLLPIDPLDGGKVFQSLFFSNRKLFQFIFSFLSSLAVISIGFYFNSWIVMLFGFLIGFKVKSLYKSHQIRTVMKEKNISYESNYESISDKTYNKIKSILIDFNPILIKIKEESDEDRYDQIIAHQVDGALANPINKDASILFKIVALLIWLGSIVLSVYTLLSIDFNSIINAF